jgi:hypothetical protein
LNALARSFFFRQTSFADAGREDDHPVLSELTNFGHATVSTPAAFSLFAKASTSREGFRGRLVAANGNRSVAAKAVKRYERDLITKTPKKPDQPIAVMATATECVTLCMRFGKIKKFSYFLPF